MTIWMPKQSAMTPSIVMITASTTRKPSLCR